MKKILFYYIALLTWIAKIIMWVTIILIPVERHLSETYEAWRKPFYYWLWVWIYED